MTYNNKTFCPYRVCPLGAHVDHQMGLVTGFALNKGITLDYDITEDGSFYIKSADYDNVAIFTLDSIPEREYRWMDFLYGAVQILSKYHNLKKGLKGIIHGDLKAGGLSSSASVILTYIISLCKANNIILAAPELIRIAIEEERQYIGVNVGKLDQSCEVYCRENNLLYLDTQNDASHLIPIPSTMPDFEIAIIFSGIERNLAETAYNTRVDECKAAAYALKGFAGIDYGKITDTYLRDIPYSIYQEHKSKLPNLWKKRAEHFYQENERVKKGIIAWRNGDLKTFGQLIFESGDSSINLYQTGSEELKHLHNILKSCDGVFGSRFSGAGFNGSTMAIIDPTKKDSIKNYIKSEYLSIFPHLAKTFDIQFCKTSDGIKLT